MHLFAFMCLEADNGSSMVSSLLGNIFLQITIGYRSFISERLVEFNDKIILEVLGNSSAIAGSITDDFVFFRDYFDV